MACLTPWFALRADCYSDPHTIPLFRSRTKSKGVIAPRHALSMYECPPHIDTRLTLAQWYSMVRRGISNPWTLVPANTWVNVVIRVRKAARWLAIAQRYRQCSIRYGLKDGQYSRL